MTGLSFPISAFNWSLPELAIEAASYAGSISL